jgi:hypothetical protein
MVDRTREFIDLTVVLIYGNVKWISQMFGFRTFLWIHQSRPPPHWDWWEIVGVIIVTVFVKDPDLLVDRILRERSQTPDFRGTRASNFF